MFGGVIMLSRHLGTGVTRAYLYGGLLGMTGGSFLVLMMSLADLCLAH